MGETYKKLIAELVEEQEDERFLKQIYSILITRKLRTRV